MYETWFCFSPTKNNIKDAATCIAKGIPSYGAAEAEYNFYNWTNKMLKLAGVEVETETEKTNYNGMSFSFGPKILLDPTFAITFQEIKNKFQGKCRIGKNATLIILDKNTPFKDLKIADGSLRCTLG